MRRRPPNDPKPHENGISDQGHYHHGDGCFIDRGIEQHRRKRCIRSRDRLGAAVGAAYGVEVLRV